MSSFSDKNINGNAIILLVLPIIFLHNIMLTNKIKKKTCLRTCKIVNIIVSYPTDSKSVRKCMRGTRTARDETCGTRARHQTCPAVPC